MILTKGVINEDLKIFFKSFNLVISTGAKYGHRKISKNNEDISKCKFDRVKVRLVYFGKILPRVSFDY